MKNRIAIKITLIYFLTGFLWILFSDRLLSTLAGSPDSLTHLQTYKGWFFVSVTAILLFLLIRNELRKKNKIEAELIKAKEKAEESDQLKSAFLSNMSHEIRTPLNGILGFCELMTDDSYNSEDKQIFAGHLTKNGNDLLKLINDIMDISRIRENQFEFSERTFELNAFLDEIFHDYQTFELRLMRNSIDFSLIKGIDNAEVGMYSDPALLSLILRNLLNNAFFFTHKGFIRFGYLKTAVGFEFFVEDSGCGINEPDQEQIFKPFFKGTQQVIGNKGFGLGLAISQGLVRLLGGELLFTSTPGNGSRFFFGIDSINAQHQHLKQPHNSKIWKWRSINEKQIEENGLIQN